MENNIYSIDEWQQSTNYYKNKIVIYNNNYYYSLIEHTSSSSFSTDLDSAKWGGIILDNGQNKPHFIWKPSYNYSVNNQPKIKTIQFGDSYKQTLKDGINNVLPITNYEFECDINECTAILHFLETRAGTESFVYLPPSPRGSYGRFICKSWNDTCRFYNNYLIQCQFERVII